MVIRTICLRLLLTSHSVLLEYVLLFGTAQMIIFLMQYILSIPS